ncbi:aminopeptidase P family protein [Rickettsia endosymbiont of Cardiosporidium cionae]|uniref:aminopeptidase P family protein n=1 Tax=Rickettsia endosymbiont of Cardiosporidium cionae TaxID=2777155 RepID=UPI0018935269|nr:aminopeptidase P family protein [Rickettsia endosymbiont of Cardiosporidium cionae]KAF8818407.1 aminopeptidase P family protein [Rickettsia endosymbiont of Cardiosporidium cionae]
MSLSALKGQFFTKAITGYLVTSTDEYLNEYTTAAGRRLEYITKFTGSNGFVIVLKNCSLFFTDSRYLLQSSKQLDSKEYIITDQNLFNSFSWNEFISEGDIIGFDPKICSIELYKRLSSVISLKPINVNLVDLVWQNKPDKPSSLIYEYPIQYSGQVFESKIAECRKLLSQHQADYMLVTRSDSVCWLFNIRASDLDFSPLLLAFAIVSTKNCYLFVDDKRLSLQLKKIFHDIVTILPEDSFTDFINMRSDKKYLFDKGASCYIHFLMCKKNTIPVDDHCFYLKSCKNQIEIDNSIDVHLYDAVAVCEFLSFIVNLHVNDRLKNFSEYDLGIELSKFRSHNSRYVCDSFPTICGFNENSSIIHYRASKYDSKVLSVTGLLLLDSGAHYKGGTTDITRTIAIGNVNPKHKYFYTKVLKGHIALARLIFPKSKITGMHIDVLARQYLWQEYEDYFHGTGHGVGDFLNVHEGPQNINYLVDSNVVLKKFMILSNEPGYYINNEFGIRIENLIYVNSTSYEKFLKFTNLTLVPYDRSLIDVSTLNRDELLYIEQYYSEIRKRVRPLLSVDTQSWLDDQLKII